MSEHTAGPWTISTCLDYWVEPSGAPDDGGFYGIAHCGDIHWPGWRDKQGEWLANARLIAEAPTLLAILKEAAEDYVVQWHDGPLLKAARAAIARAEGKANER